MSVGRRSIAGTIAALLGVFAWACDGPQVGPPDNPVPILESIEPSLVPRSAGPLSIDVTGLGFVEGSEARWNGEARATSHVDDTHLQVTLSAEDLLASSGQIDVVNPAPGGGASAVLELVVGNAIPTLSSLSPTEAPAVLTSQVELQALGSDFLLGATPSVLLWNGIPLATEVSGATTLSAMVPDYLLRVGYTAEVAVRNPGPGGGSSNPLYFDVENPIPSVTGTEPEGVPVNVDADLDVLGAGFVYGASVSINGTSVTPTIVSGARLRVRVPGSATEGSTGLAVVRVLNPAPGGGTSNDFDLAVWLAPPRIDYLYPALVFAGTADFDLVISGADFDPGATVLLNSAAHAATIVSTSRIELSVSSAEVASEGTVQITVVNPFGAGEASADLEVLAPTSGSILLAERGDELALLDLTGNEVLVVPTGSGSYRVDASPIGATAVYQTSGRIFEIDPSSGVERRVSTASADAALSDEQWAKYSADGAWIYFMGLPPGGRWELWRTPSVGGSSTQLLAKNDDLGYPSPSHRGERVVYARGVSEGSSAALEVLDVTTSVSTPLGVQGATSRWSPDDEWIVYWTWGRELRAIRPDGTGDFALTSGIQLAAGFDFSPTGDVIVAAREDGTGAVLIAFPSGTVSPLPGAGSVGSMAWYGP